LVVSVVSEGMARQKEILKRSVWMIREQSKSLFNNAIPSAAAHNWVFLIVSVVSEGMARRKEILKRSV